MASDLSMIDDESFAITISGSNMYIVGYDSNTVLGDDQRRIEKRSLSNGSMVASFGTTTPGVVVSNPSNATIDSFDDANAVAIDSTAMYVVGFDSVAGDGDWSWRIEKRDLVSVASETCVGTSGFISENNSVGSIGGSDYEALAVAVDHSPTGGLHVVGYYSLALQGKEWRIEARDKSTGVLVSSATPNISVGADVAYGIPIDPAEGYMYVIGSDTLRDSIRAIEVDSSYVYVAGYESVDATNSRWRIMKLAK